jgi:hypothetical protein
MKYWEIIADNLKKAGWSWGCVSAIDSCGRTIWIADAHRGDGKRFVVRADEKLTAFMELESAGSDRRLDFLKIVLTLFAPGGQSCARAKSVRHLPQELHLTLFPQGKTANDRVRSHKQPKNIKSSAHYQRHAGLLCVDRNE